MTTRNIARLVLLMLLAATPARASSGTVGIAQTSATSVELAWEQNPAGDGVTGYKIHYGVSPTALTTVVDTGNVCLSSVCIATVNNLVTGAHYYFAVTAYTPIIESGLSNVVDTVLTLPEDCVPPLGAHSVSVFITRKIATTGAVGSMETLYYQLASPNSPITSIQPMLNRQPVGPGLRGTDLTADGGIWFKSPLMPGSYNVSLVVSNASGCSTTASKDGAGKTLVTTVK
jgi:hypothetical protein